MKKPDYINKNIKKVSKADMIAAIKKAQVRHVTFEHFKSVSEIAVYFSEKMDRQDIEEVMNELYELYREMNYHEPIDFLKFHLIKEQVNRDTHDFWLDPKGMFIVTYSNKNPICMKTTLSLLNGNMI